MDTNSIEVRVDALERAIVVIAAAVHEAALLALRPAEPEPAAPAPAPEAPAPELRPAVPEPAAPAAPEPAAPAPEPAAAAPAPAPEAPAPELRSAVPEPAAPAPEPAAPAPEPAAAAAAPAPAPEAPAPEPAAAKHPALEYTYDETAAILTQHFNKLGAGKTSTILAQFKATRLSDLVPSQYPALVQVLKESLEQAGDEGDDENAFL